MTYKLLVFKTKLSWYASCTPQDGLQRGWIFELVVAVEGGLFESAKKIKTALHAVFDQIIVNDSLSESTTNWK